jgi:hypothetical protein
MIPSRRLTSGDATWSEYLRTFEYGNEGQVSLLSSLKNILRFELLFTEINETINDSFSHLASNVTKSSLEKVDAAPALVPIGRIGAISLHNVQVRIGGIEEASKVNNVKVLDLTKRRADNKSTQSMMSNRAINLCVRQICWKLESA